MHAWIREYVRVREYVHMQDMRECVRMRDMCHAGGMQAD